MRNAVRIARRARCTWALSRSIAGETARGRRWSYDQARRQRPALEASTFRRSANVAARSTELAHDDLVGEDPELAQPAPAIAGRAPRPHQPIVATVIAAARRTDDAARLELGAPLGTTAAACAIDDVVAAIAATAAIGWLASPTPSPMFDRPLAR
jgi:hypothetical protein